MTLRAAYDHQIAPVELREQRRAAGDVAGCVGSVLIFFPAPGEWSKGRTNPNVLPIET